MIIVLVVIAAIALEVILGCAVGKWLHACSGDGEETNELESEV